jgi:hypothetical protein
MAADCRRAAQELHAQALARLAGFDDSRTALLAASAEHVDPPTEARPPA